jgi:hypothetical protein
MEETPKKNTRPVVRSQAEVRNEAWNVSETKNADLLNFLINCVAIGMSSGSIF